MSIKKMGIREKKSSRDRHKALFISFNSGAYVPFKFNRRQSKTSNLLHIDHIKDLGF